NTYMNTVFDSIVSEFESSKHDTEYNVWFKAKIEKAIVDTRPTMPHDQVVAYFKKRRVEREANRNG
ncbi:type II toxin-antitoxin system RelB family antitoxin, partial [Acinetobacter lactucae]|uniref:type II toxin-antitoxin system RelB family antitoxin n=1 Tax=Acinetobacter lactucae TaxID=1785128 RepID=UPI003F68D21D